MGRLAGDELGGGGEGIPSDEVEVGLTARIELSEDISGSLDDSLVVTESTVV